MRRINILLLMLFTCLASVAWPQAQAPGKFTFTKINAPGAGTGRNQGTFAFSINSKGQIAGEYIDAKSVYHGFLRNPDGSKIQKINVPGAGTGFHQGTRAGGDERNPLNAAGAIAGWYVDSHNTSHGYLRKPNGEIQKFDAPDAGNGSGQGTEASEVNSVGEVTGWYKDARFVWHGFWRNPDGSEITEFDVPDAGTGSYQGTLASGKWGDVIWGFYVDANSAWHGFLLNPDGTITRIDAPHGGTHANQGTVPFGVNSKTGVMVGFSKDANFTWHGFRRRPNGKIKEFDAPGSGTGRDRGTVAASINPTGWITASCVTRTAATSRSWMLRARRARALSASIPKGRSPDSTGTRMVYFTDSF